MKMDDLLNTLASAKALPHNVYMLTSNWGEPERVPHKQCTSGHLWYVPPLTITD